MVPPNIGREIKICLFYFFRHMLHHNVNRMHARSRSVKCISIIIFLSVSCGSGRILITLAGIYVPIASKPSVRGFTPLQAHLRLFSVHNLQLKIPHFIKSIFNYLNTPFYKVRIFISYIILLTVMSSHSKK